MIKNPAAVKLGALGGKARASKYSKEELSAMGKKGGRPILCPLCKQKVGLDSEGLYNSHGPGKNSFFCENNGKPKKNSPN